MTRCPRRRWQQEGLTFPCTPDLCSQTNGHYSSMKRGCSGKVWIQSDLYRFVSDQWIKSIRICWVYFKNGTFTTYHNNGRPCWISLLKYTERILKKFPCLNQTLPDTRIPDSLREWIATQLRFILDVIQPQLTNRLRASYAGLHRDRGRKSHNLHTQ